MKKYSVVKNGWGHYDIIRLSDNVVVYPLSDFEKDIAEKECNRLNDKEQEIDNDTV